MSDSLSIIVPVRNEEATLDERLLGLLEVAAELTHEFEFLIVDEGSADQTAEVARDLARRFPQLRVIAIRPQCGRDEAIRAGLAAARGQTVLVLEDSYELSAAGLRKLWSLRHDDELVSARVPSQSQGLEAESIERLSTWSQTLRKLSRQSLTSGIQMIRRDAAQSPRRERSGGIWPPSALARGRRYEKI